MSVLKIKNGNDWVNIPMYDDMIIGLSEAVYKLQNNSTSDEIFNAFGNLSNYNNIITKSQIQNVTSIIYDGIHNIPAEVHGVGYDLSITYDLNTSTGVTRIIKKITYTTNLNKFSIECKEINLSSSNMDGGTY